MFDPPKTTFNRRFDADITPSQFSSFSPNKKEIATLLALAHRIGTYVGEELAEDRRPLFDLQVPNMTPPPRQADQGLPLGGIGCGSIGRSHTGHFNRIDFQPGRCKSGIVRGIQFAVRGQRNNEPATGTVLSMLDQPKPHESCGDLHHWNWGSLKASQCIYHALFPRAWYTYNQPFQDDPHLRLTCRQINPISPHDYEDSALPATVFRWRFENTGKHDIDVSMMFAFDPSMKGSNTTGGSSRSELDPSTTSTFSHTEYQPSNNSGGVSGVTMAGIDFIPKTTLRPKWMDHASRHRCCTFREFVLFLFLFVLNVVVVGPYLYLTNTWDEQWVVWVVATVLLLFCSQIAFYVPCQIHTRWINRHFKQGCCDCLKSKHTYEYHATKVAYTISADTTNENVKTTVSMHYPTTGSLHSQKGNSSMWENFVATGEATTVTNDAGGSGGGGGGCAVAQSMTLKAGETRELRFGLSWASPIVHFGQDMVVSRRYARLYKPTASPSSFRALDTLQAALEISEQVSDIALLVRQQWKQWEVNIDRWQRKVLNNDTLPTWYKSQLFNELYFLQAGGAVWCDKITDGTTSVKEEEFKSTLYTTPSTGSSSSKGSSTLDTVGHWLYLEGQEYFMYNTADVHFYASAALAMNWPLIERSIQCDYATAVLQEDTQMRGQLGEPRWGTAAMRKPFGIVPHDVGSPSGLPWIKNNAYHFQDVSRWKDLGSKFVLQVMRDYRLRTCSNLDQDGQDGQETSPQAAATLAATLAAKEETQALRFVAQCWPAVLAVMAKMQDFDTDNDGMIENEGFPDQTYDIWSAKGPSAYSGGLWLAALQAASCLARLMNDDIHEKKFHALFRKGQRVYEDVLWNNTTDCYDYDGSDSAHHDSIMADQMAGEWFSRACHFEGVAFRSKQALKTVYRTNVLGFQNGTMGAMNGMRPDGSIDTSSMQSQEVWTGTTYAVAAAMIHVGLKEEGFRTASGIHHSGWHHFGYFFQTPEGWNCRGNYRSLGYMRALSIWNMQWALEVEQRKKDRG